jgi:hypothetical protein
MNGGLFDNLIGRSKNDIPVEVIPTQLRDILSLAFHLELMFNTLIGTCANRKYGLPSDLPETIVELPINLEEISEIVKNSVLIGEPRLLKPMVVNWSINKKECCLQGILIGTYKENRVKLRIVLKSMGKYRVELFEGTE